MTYKGLWRLTWTVMVSITLAACESGDRAMPAIDFDLPQNSGSISTSDSSISLNGTAASEHPIDSVSWINDRGGSGVAQGGENWQIFSIGLSAGENRITVTATDTGGNSNERGLTIIRDSESPSLSDDNPGNSESNTEVSVPVLMYSYHADLRNAAPANGATIDAGPVHFYVVPSDSWRKSGIDHMAYYCCDKPGAGGDDTSKLAVSREPWSMIIDLSSYSPGERRGIDLEANLKSGAVQKANDYDFTLASASGGTNRAPSISGNPASEAETGSTYEFRPNASDADGDTLSFSVANLPPWANFDEFSGRLWGTPGATDVGIHGSILISVSDGKTSTALRTFSITVNEADTPAPPPPPPPPPPPAENAPTISSFTASSAAITRGQSVTLRWNVSNADSISISPQPGQVSGSSVSVSPSTTTTYTLTARNGGGTSTARVTVSVMTGSSDWNVTEGLPSLSNPTVINLSSRSTSSYPAVGISCAGQIYSVRLGDNEDAVVHMSGSQPLRYPVHVTGGRNVRIVGLHFDLATQSGCGIGRLPNLPVAQHPNANIHPRIPGGIALRLQQSGTSFVEGLHIDVKGHEADCIVSRNPDSMSDAAAQSRRDVVIQNTYCSGVEGLPNTDIGDGVHGDLFQNQGGDILRRLVFENVSMRTSQEGIVLHGNGSFSGTKSLVIRRYDYTWDPRYVGDDAYERFGLAFAGWPGPDWTLENIRIDDYRDGGDYIKIGDQRYGSFSSSTVQAHPEIRSGLPAEGAFALPGRTGVNYTSPHGSVP